MGQSRRRADRKIKPLKTQRAQRTRRKNLANFAPCMTRKDVTAKQTARDRKRFFCDDARRKTGNADRVCRNLPAPARPLQRATRTHGNRARVYDPGFLVAEKQPDDTILFFFDIPPQSPTVRGLASILHDGLNGSTLGEILSVPADFYLPMNLQEAVSQQRLNGFVGVLAHMKHAAVHPQSG